MTSYSPLIATDVMPDYAELRERLLSADALEPLGGRIVRHGSGNSRRRHPRVPISLAARFTVVGQGSRALTGRIIDVSSQGVGIEVEGLLDHDALVLVDCASGLFAGTIRYCRTAGSLYRAGLCLEDLPASRNAVASLRRVPGRLLTLAS